jgi:hypothetical protein
MGEIGHLKVSAGYEEQPGGSVNALINGVRP